MKEFETEVLFRPDSDQLRFLPEGPYPCGSHHFSWVGIQHGAESKVGSLNIFDTASGHNQTFELDGRPGFAAPTNSDDSFVIGLERRIGIFNTRTAAWEQFCDGVDQHVDNTIINDGVVFASGIVFGTKELTFSQPIAGLYFWRSDDGQLFHLRDDQICSNGKVMLGYGETVTLLDIDSPTKKVMRYTLNVTTGELSDAETVVDLTANNDFPDGMIATPDGKSVIIAFYNPNDIAAGEARQYDLASGAVQTVWTTPGSPQVTCPQLLSLDGQIKLVLTTAVEHMTAEQQTRHPQAGCLFVGPTEFTSLPDQPRLEL